MKKNWYYAAIVGTGMVAGAVVANIQGENAEFATFVFTALVSAGVAALALKRFVK